MSKNKQVSVSLPPELVAAIEQESKDLAISRTAVIRMRLKERYDQMSRESRISAYDQHRAPSPAGVAGA